MTAVRKAMMLNATMLNVLTKTVKYPQQNSVKETRSAMPQDVQLGFI